MLLALGQEHGEQVACRILQSPVEMRRLGEACERARVQLVADSACCAAHATANFDGVPLSVSLSREAFEHLAGTAAAAAAAGVSDEVRMVVDVMIRTLEREAATTAVEKAAKLRVEAAVAKERLAALKAKRPPSSCTSVSTSHFGQSTPPSSQLSFSAPDAPTAAPPPSLQPSPLLSYLHTVTHAYSLWPV